MPSSSSAKKVARVAARSGSGSPVGANAAKQRNWLFALAILAILGLGVGVVTFARSTNNDRSKNDTPPRANLGGTEPFDHWHAAFALNVCGNELAPIAQPATDPNGIHTHGDGLIHIHPFGVNVAGKRAKMKVFWDLVDLKVTDEGFTDPATGKTYKEGVTKCGNKEGQVVLAYWKDGSTAASTKPTKIYTSDFKDVNYTSDLTAYTLAFVPKGDTDITAPSASSEITTLGACDGENPPASCSNTDITNQSTIPDTIPATTTKSSGG